MKVSLFVLVILTLFVHTSESEARMQEPFCGFFEEVYIDIGMGECIGFCLNPRTDEITDWWIGCGAPH